MKAVLIILGAVLLTAGLIRLHLAALRRRHPNAELLNEALQGLAEKKPGAPRQPSQP